jgi:dimethylaniline monooxygenase (N-oxide forming)
MMKVCVVGAGPLGLTTIKQLLDEGHQVTCFEKQNDLGGLWYRSGDDAEQTKAYDNLMLTTSMRLMAFSDFMPEGERVFYSREQYLSYLRAYADQFHLRERIVFETAVEGITRTPDDRWQVTIRSDGEQWDHLFDAVAFCPGGYGRPNMNLPDLDKFTGEVLHSAHYRNAERFAGRRVLVVGLAESGADVLREVSEVATQCTLSVRTHVKLVPRLHKGNIPTDATRYRAGDYEKWVRACPIPYPTAATFGDSFGARVLFKACATVYGAAAVAAKLWSKVSDPRASSQLGDLAASGLNPLGEPLVPEKMDVGTQMSQEAVAAIEEWNLRSHAAVGGSYTPKAIYCKNVSFIPNVLNGKIDVKHGEVRGISGKTVSFSDGTQRDFDAIVLAIGFLKNFSILKNVEIKDNNVRNLYKHAFPPECGGRLALIGFVRPFNGGNPVCAEMQARYFALLCSGKVKLPADVHERIRREKAWEEAQTILSPRHTESTPSQPLFTDSIAKEIGCLPTMSDLIADPPMFIKHWFGSFNQSSYRLVGPHNTYADARRRIMDEWMIGSGLILRDLVLSWLPHFMHASSLTTPRRIMAKLPKAGS